MNYRKPVDDESCVETCRIIHAMCNVINQFALKYCQTKFMCEKVMSHHLFSLLRKDKFYVYYTWNLLKHNMQVTGSFYFFPGNQVPWVDILTLLDTEWLALSRIWHYNRSSRVKSWNTKQAPFSFFVLKGDNKGQKDNIVHERTLVVYTWYTWYTYHKTHRIHALDCLRIIFH